MKHFQWDNQDLILKLYIQPNAHQDKVIGLFNDQLKIQISARAVDNKANNYLQKWLAQEFQVPKTQVLLIKGAHARQKTFKIKSPKIVPDWLEI
ncbi:MAG: YggU family protein [Proteobacteria bacterium]|nr:YggU family protein [Pseudomonadota bacterium]